MARSRQRILEEYLVLASQGGDERALEKLVRLVQPRLLRHARRCTTDGEAALDAVQEAWIAIARGLRRLADPAGFLPWALEIVARRCADVGRRQRRRRSSEARAAVSRASGARTADPEVERLREALRALPAEQRVIVELHHLERLGVTEIGRALGLPPGTVKSRLHRARQHLKDMLERSVT